MGRMVVVSARVEEELKRRAEELGINISAIVRRALEEEVRRREIERFIQQLRRRMEKGPEMPEGVICEVIREMRDHEG